ncbi:MAG: hypothetical protein AAFX79_05475 [Planctomycetota bacterium]
MTGVSDPSTAPAGGLVAAYRRLPRAMRWSLWAVGGFAAYFAVAEPIVDAVVGASRDAQQAEARIRAVAEMGERAEADARTIAFGSRLHGPIHAPEPRSERAIALNRAVDAALRDAGVRDARTDTSTRVLPDGPATRAYGDRGSLVQLESTVQFVSSPEQLAHAVGTLEGDPAIAGLTRLVVRNAGDGTRSVNATMTVVAWALAEGEQRGGARSRSRP